MIVIASCKTSQVNTETPQVAAILISGDSILIPVQSTIGKKIKKITVTPEDVQLPFITTATVKAIPECIADVAVPFDGRIVESFVKSGQTVKTGSPLFSIHSPIFFETVKSLLQARQEKQVAELNLHRQQDLVDHGVGIRKELDEAKLNFEITKGQVDNLMATLAIYSVNEKDLKVGKPLIVTSPIKGEVVRNSIRVGQYLTASSEPMVCVADLKKVWIVARIKENNIGWVQNQDEVQINIDAYPRQPFTGTVSYIGKILDEQTRSLEVIIECDNTAQLLKPGMFATATFNHARQEGLVIPATALVQEENNVFIYKDMGNELYLKTKVEVSSAFGGKVAVLNGLNSGESIISEGCIYLH